MQPLQSLEQHLEVSFCDEALTGVKVLSKVGFYNLEFFTNLKTAMMNLDSRIGSRMLKSKHVRPRLKLSKTKLFFSDTVLRCDF